MKNMKTQKFFDKFLLCACLLLSLFLTACRTCPPADALQAVRERGVLLVGATGDYQPMSFLNQETKTYVGFDAALAEDFACGITITDARKKQALMSDGYLVNGKTVLCRKEDAAKYTSLAAINRPEVRVMENPGGLNEKFARANLPQATLTIHPVNEEIPRLIAEGKADVMITEIMEAAFYCSRDARLAAPLINAPFTHGQLGALLPPGNEALRDCFNLFLQQLRQTGRLAELEAILLRGEK